MEKLTINFFTLDNGLVKAVVYRDTNKYLYEATGSSEADCLRTIANRHVFHMDTKSFEDTLNEAIARRAE
jgi:hypothetical protein